VCVRLCVCVCVHTSRLPVSRVKWTQQNPAAALGTGPLVDLVLGEPVELKFLQSSSHWGLGAERGSGLGA